ncbi:MAST4 [Cordylochernes scorpioides]|uniref:Serine/threonine-protein kinase greatwall n=1 Tax=Cordylochernes scorpioides TaxID=51811 RepID=A0ABY6KKH0_9ARAC|nr:MAST4 [Cordylochernes scorpioides]
MWQAVASKLALEAQTCGLELLEPDYIQSFQPHMMEVAYIGSKYHLFNQYFSWLNANLYQGVIHAHGIVHRDLKPENLLISRDDHIKVSDYGLSRININNQDKESSEDRLCGTPCYIAPETILYR